MKPELKRIDRVRPAVRSGAGPASGHAGPGRIKVCLVAVGLGIGGTEGQLLELATRLDPRRFDVLVCSLKEDGVIAQELRARGSRVVSLSGRGAWDLRVPVRLWRLLGRERPDIVHGFLLWANVAVRLAGRLRNVPIIVSSYRNVVGWNNLFHRLLDRVTARWSDAATCCSEAVRRLAERYAGGNGGRYVTIANGVDLERYTSVSPATKAELGLQEGLPVVGTVCRLDEPVKGLSVLLQAFAQVCLRSRPPGCQLLIVGQGPALARLHRLASTLGIASRVVFAGEHRDVSRLLPLMEVFVLPSREEGFGIAIVEAMAAGLPVVATAVGGIPEIVEAGETGLLVPPNDPEALAGAIHEVLSDRDRAETLGARGRARASALFSIESCVERHAALYEGLFHRSGRRTSGWDAATVSKAARDKAPVSS